MLQAPLQSTRILCTAGRQSVCAIAAEQRTGSGGILKLHDDVQSCGYKDVQVMFDMITSELEAASQGAQKQLPSPRKGAVPRPPSAWPGRSSSTIAAAPAQ